MNNADNWTGVRATLYVLNAKSANMEITRQFIRTFVIVLGILVLLSYVYGVSKSSDATALWGGIPLSWTNLLFRGCSLLRLVFLCIGGQFYTA